IAPSGETAAIVRRRRSRRGRSDRSMGPPTTSVPVRAPRRAGGPGTCRGSVGDSSGMANDGAPFVARGGGRRRRRIHPPAPTMKTARRAETHRCFGGERSEGRRTSAPTANRSLITATNRTWIPVQNAAMVLVPPEGARPMNQLYLADQVILERLREAADWRRAADATRGRHPSGIAGFVRRLLAGTTGQTAEAATLTAERPASVS